MNRMLVGGAAAVLVCLALTACGNNTSAGGQRVKPKPPAAEPIEPPEKKMKDQLNNQDKAEKPKDPGAPASK